MDLSKLRIEVDSDDTWRTPKGNRAQKFYVHGLSQGGKYPKEVTRVMDEDDKPLSKGIYAVGGFTIDWGKIVVDYNQLTPVSTTKA